MDRRHEYRNRYYPSTPVPVSPARELEAPKITDLDLERAFVVEGNGRTVLSAPLREVAATNKGFLYLHGRFVEADTPNRNGAMWSTEDLELGKATVAGGPLNWLHQEHKIVGALLSADLVLAREQSQYQMPWSTTTNGLLGTTTTANSITITTEKAATIGNHIQSTAALWRFLYPQEAATVEKAAADRQLWYSMECISSKVACVEGRGNGCGETFSYTDFLEKKTCSHLAERASVRRFVDPVFLGGALIVPPVAPGWANADVDVVREAASVAEERDLAGGNMTRREAEALVQQVLAYANR